MNFDNEWVESTVVRSIRQIMSGGSMYPTPSVEFLGDGYPPLYFHVCATLAAIFGSPLFVARSVSLVGTLLVAAALYKASSAKIGETTPDGFFRPDRLFPPLMFLSFYAASGQVFDLARVDMMTIALSVWAALLALRHDTHRSALLAGLLMACAIMAKHNMLLIAAAIGLAVLVSNFKRSLTYGLATLLIPIAFFLQLNVRTDGWSNYHLFRQLANNEFGGQARWIRFFGEDISWHGVLLFVLLAAAFASIWKVSNKPERNKLIAPFIIAPARSA
ncbi:MAG: hypothetical protein IPK83_13045 [Planctomycetes bacterium]|nr:hypothetical protein [Planctomycetota bacterium]